GQFFVEASEPLEAWLMGWDRRLFGDPAARFAAWPRTITAVFESAYFATFLLLPAGCAVLLLGGHEAAVSHYWTIVTAAEFGAFGPLAFVQSRPPWSLEAARQSEPAPFRRFGLQWVRRTSHCANTFPSGHAAGSLAVAFGVLPVMPAAGVVLLAVALTICAASVVGRYHYAVDVIAGVLLTVLVVLVL
ncbi:MAG TPA: phosphatase PAP2 family protein, partial [Rhodanobacteraceae bacterium]